MPSITHTQTDTSEQIHSHIMNYFTFIFINLPYTFFLKNLQNEEYNKAVDPKETITCSVLYHLLNLQMQVDKSGKKSIALIQSV